MAVFSLSLYVISLVSGVLSVPAGAAPACPPNSTGCQVYVFHVTLSQKAQGEKISSGFIKPVSKLGNNVYEFKKEIMDGMPTNVDPRVKQQIASDNYYLKAVEEGASPPKNLPLPPPPPPQMQTPLPPSSAPSPYGNRLLLIIIGSMVAVGVFVGVLCTCLVLMFLKYNKKPKIDRSNAVTYKKISEVDRLTMEEQRRQTADRQRPRYAKLHQPTVAASSNQSNWSFNHSDTSSRTGPAVPPRPARLSRERRLELQRAASRESERRMRQRKNSF